MKQFLYNTTNTVLGRKRATLLYTGFNFDDTLHYDETKEKYAQKQGLSSYGSRPHLGSHGLVLGSRNKFKTNWLYSSELKAFVTLTRKLKVDLQ